MLYLTAKGAIMYYPYVKRMLCNCYETISITYDMQMTW